MSVPTYSSRRLRICLVFLCGVALAGLAFLPINQVLAQSSQNSGTTNAPVATPALASQTQPPSGDAPEMNAHDAPVPLRVRVNLVPIRVVVRDQQGHAVASLQKEDFQLFQDGKPQEISNFAVETLSSLSQHVVQPQSVSTANSGEPKPAAFLPPSRFVAFLFDDPHLNLQDLMQARIAAGRYLDASLTPTDRLAIFTVSGQNQVDFTDDRAKLHKALLQLLPRDITGTAATSSFDCPHMDYFEADMIQNQNDSQAVSVATEDALQCDVESDPALASAIAAGSQVPPGALSRAQGQVSATALRVAEQGTQQSLSVFRRIEEITARMAALPGQRSIVLISPGFIYPTLQIDYSQVVDRAIRNSVFINALDTRGLYTPQLGPDISEHSNDPNPAAAGVRTGWSLAGQERQVDTLMYLASDTGGNSFRNNNDLGEGLRQVASAPEAYYYLAFVPENFKFDGRYHSLKVALRTKNKFAIQTRRGYYAPLHGESPVDVAKRDVEDAVFSQEEQHGLPVALQTQFFKTDATDAKLAVLAHVDLAHMHFEKTGGRNQNSLTVVAALFDRNGNFITGTERTVEMKLRDETLERLSRTGVTVRTNFDVKPGDYVVRLVVRDSHAALLSAENGVVEIPY
jgi:VWFA-related protein